MKEISITIEEILDRHYIESDKQNIIALFEKYRLMESVEKTIRYIKTCLSKDYVTSKTPITITSTTFLTEVNNEIKLINDAHEKEQTEIAIARIGLELLSLTKDRYPREYGNLLYEITTALEASAELNGYDKTALFDLLKLNNITTETPKLEWTGKVALDILTHCLVKKQWIQKQKDFECLFRNTGLVKFDFTYKKELAYLLHILKEQDYLLPKNGFFSIAEKNIVSYSGERLKKDNLKRMSSKINKDRVRNEIIIQSVEAIILDLQTFKK